MARRRDGNTRALIAARENRDFCPSMLHSGSNLSSRFKSGPRLSAWFAPHQSLGRTKWSACPGEGCSVAMGRYGAGENATAHRLLFNFSH